MAGPKAFVIGHPVAHSRSPLIHEHWLGEMGLAGSYSRVDVAPAALPSFLGGFQDQGYVGGNVTIPHKEVALRLVDETTDLARRIGAVNTISTDPDGRTIGDNTDAPGYIAQLDDVLGPDWRQGSGPALVLGSGGAARAVVAGLLDAGLDRVLVAGRDLGRADRVRDLDPKRIEVIAWKGLHAVLPGVSLLVNTTPLGMAGQSALTIDLAGLRDDAVVSDIVYVPLETPLLADARARGLRSVDGLGMLLHQAVPGFAAWFGVTPQVTPRLRALLAADIERAA
jgi:shikimate dehydrogenase